MQRGGGMLNKALVSLSCVYLLAITIMLGGKFVTTFAATYGYGYGYGYENRITQQQQIQRDALLALYNSTEGKLWRKNSGWNGLPGSECTWYGVGCKGKTLTKLQLSGNNLKGTIPDELGLLKDLTELDLSDNLIRGSIPDSFKGLTRLNWLSLNNNQLSGEMPTSLAEVVSLQRLYLAGNSFTGSVPDSYQTLSNLSILYLSYNKLSGEIPNYIDKLTNLGYLLLDHNLFSGNIPQEIGQLKNLIALTLNANSLSGNIPEELFNLSKLEYLLLDENQLIGSLPEQIGSLGNLTYLSISDNELSGAIPTGIGLLQKLNTLDIASNNFSDSLGSKIDNLTRLKSLDLSHNQFTGVLPSEIENFKELTNLDVSDNSFHGSLPVLADIESLKILDISNNRFENPLPEWVSSSNFETLNYENALNNLPKVQILPVFGSNKTSDISSSVTTYEIIDSDGLPGEYLSLSGLVREGDGPVTQVAWLVDGNIASASYNLESRFSDKQLKIEFNAIDDLGGVSFALIQVDILPPIPPSAQIIDGQSNYVDTDGVIGETIKFKGLASDLDGSVINQRWFVGDQEVATGSEALISLPNGSSTIVFQVTDNVGLQASQLLDVFIEPPQYTPTLSWPYPYNGAAPDSNLNLLLNNIAMYESSTGLWRSCAKLVMNDRPYIVNGASSFDVNFKLVSNTTPALQLDSLRTFNETGALLNSGELPNCSGQIDLDTGLYEDTVSSGNLTFETMFELVDEENLVFNLKDFKQLSLPE